MNADDWKGSDISPELLWSMQLAEQDKKFVESLGLVYDPDKDYGFLQSYFPN